MDQETASTDDTGATANPVVALLLSFLAPGLGLVYVGRLLAGLVVNVFVLLLVLLFVIAAALFQFFPLYPGLVVVATWLTFCALSGWKAYEIANTGDAQRQRSYQHPLIYALIGLLTFMAPLAITGHFTARHLMTVISVDDIGMFPQGQPGDRVLIDRTSYKNAPPERGDLVVVRVPNTGELAILRVVAVPEDKVEIRGYTLIVNDEFTDYSPVDASELNRLSSDTDDTELWVEYNQDHRYVISIIPGTSVDDALPEMILGDGQYLVLSDNRSALGLDTVPPMGLDSRSFGPISAHDIEGRPTFITWSTASDSKTPRWDRIGLATR